MRFYQLILGLTLLGSAAQAQLPTINPFVLSTDARTPVALFDIKTPGTFYYDGAWNAGHIYLSSGDSLAGYYIRYDLIKNHLEVLWGSRKVGIYGTNIASFYWFSPARQQLQKFISKREFTFQNPENVAGFLEILADGEVRLLKSKTIIPRYQGTSPSLVPDDGSSDLNSIKDYFLVRGDDVFKVSGRKKLMEFLSSEKAETFMKTQKLNLNSEEDLIKVIEYYNDNCADT